MIEKGYRLGVIGRRWWRSDAQRRRIVLAAQCKSLQMARMLFSSMK